MVQEDLLAPQRLIFGEIEEHDHDAIQLFDFRFVQIVLGNANITLAYAAAFPIRQPHVRLGGIGTCGDEFRRSLAGHGKVQLVLHDLEYGLSLCIFRRVVRRQSKDVAHPQIHPLLAGANVANPLQQFVKIIRHTWARRVFKPLVVHGEALEQILAQTFGGPLTELRTAPAAHAEADGKDGGEAVMLDLTGNLPHSLGLNYSIASNSCPGLQFSFGVNLFQMMIHRIHTNLKQIGHQLLRQPNAFVFEPALNARLPVLGLVEDEAGCRK